VWDCIVEVTRLRSIAANAIAQPKLTDEKRQYWERRAEELRRELARLMLQILPYERSRQIKVDATNVTTILEKPDLSWMTDAQLDLLEQIALRIGPSRGGGAQHSAGMDTRGASQTPGGARGPAGQKRLRKTP
jgi:hypothetical protein